jgi:ADP-glucose pyrophosphorylase
MNCAEVLQLTSLPVGVDDGGSAETDHMQMEIDREGRVLRFVEKPKALPAIPDNPGKFLVSMQGLD